MTVRTVKIGCAAGNGGQSHTSSPNSKSSKTLHESAANMIEPFPSPRVPLGKQYLPNIPPARYNNMVLNQGKVKSVLSGDSLILSALDNPERERTLSLAYCTSPHLKKEGDEPWAFESRDALRKMVVGKQVQFNVLYTIPNTKREYGIVYLMDGSRLPEKMVEEGWLKLREDAGRKEDSEEALQQLDKLRLQEATARAEDKGLWAPGNGRIDVQHDMGDPQTFLDTWKGKTVDGLVERVLSGDRMLVRLLISPTKHIQGKKLRPLSLNSAS
jgi:staphylococcal nuclease domain-containing protein 1